MPPTPGALSARVSSDPQAEAQTIASHVAAWRERVTAAGWVWPAALPLLEAGDRGATLMRPALERLRAVIAGGAVDRGEGPSPERLARQYASHVVLGDALRRAGGEGIFLNRALGQRPADARRLPVQGMSAASERATILERHRRGKRHAARVGGSKVLRGAPSGDRDRAKDAGGGQARDEIVPDAARLIRQVCDWLGRDRLTLGEGCRRLTHAGERTRTGKTGWERSAGWGRLRPPASRGTAACGKPRQEPLRPRRRAQRGRAVPPRRAVSTVDVPREAWGSLPVPAIVEPAVCATVQEPWREQHRHARHSRRGARSLLQGVRQCQPCGEAFYGKRLSPSARKGKPRASADYRCWGTEAYRVGGERLGQHTQVRTARLDLAVWQAVGMVLAPPERLAEESRRRVPPETRATHPSLAPVAEQSSQLRQGVARLIDREADGLMDQSAFAPRIIRLRQRLARRAAQRQALAEEAALQGEWQLMMGRLADVAAKLHDGLEAADWASTRDRIRALGKRVDVARDEVNIVFRIDPYPGDADPEKKVGNFVGGVASPLLANIYLNQLDRYMEYHYLDLSDYEKQTRRKKGLGNYLYVRYADGTPVQAWNT